VTVLHANISRAIGYPVDYRKNKAKGEFSNHMDLTIPGQQKVEEDVRLSM
jgi:hypothetical protein